MKLSYAFLVIGVCLISTLSNISAVSTTMKATTAAPTTTKAPTTTAAPTTTKAVTTTAAPTTTKAVTTTAAPTTTKAVTTTAAPTTTKAVTTTAAPTTTKVVTTTAAPTTTAVMTTTTEVTTTMAPTTTTMITTPTPEITYRVSDVNGSACILEQLMASFSISYMANTADNKTEKRKITYELPPNSDVDATESKCGTNETQPMMSLVWGVPTDGNRFNQIFTMATNHSALSNVTLFIKHTDALFPNSTQLGELVEYTAVLPSTTFMVDSGMAYTCHASQSFKLGSDANVTFSNVKLQTQGIVNDTFGNEAECPQDTPTSTPATSTTQTIPATTLAPAVGRWNVTGKGGVNCLMVKMTLQFNITYKNTKNKTVTVLVDLPETANQNRSVCGNTTGQNANSMFILDFDAGWYLEMDFMYNKTTNMYNNTKLMLHYIYDSKFTDPMEAGKSANASTGQSKISASVNDYYSCMADTDVMADEVDFMFKDVEIQPFAYATNGTLGTPAPCAADEKFNNIVPIAVGCALAGLVIIVLVAYLIGRQRSSKSGYESV